MYSSNDRMAIRRARVDFSRTGWQQFEKLNRKLGKRFLQAFILRSELAAYLTAYEAAGVQLDTECQEVRYEDGVYLLLRRTQGVWYITDVFAAEPVTAFEPVYVWKQLKRGASYFMIRVLACWRALVRKAVAWA